MNRVYLFLFSFLFLISFTSAISVNIPQPPIVTGGNYSINVNHSSFSDYATNAGLLQGLTPQQVANLAPSPNLSSYINYTNDTLGDSFLVKNTNTATLNMSALDDRYMSGGVRVYWFTNQTNANGNKNMTLTIPTNLLSTITKTLSSSAETEIASFITQKQTSPVTYVGGMRHIYLDSNLADTNRVVQLQARVYLCENYNELTDTCGKQTSYVNSSTCSDLSTVTNLHELSYNVQNIYTLNTSNRFMVKVYATKTSGGTTNINLYVDDNSYSRIQVPSPVGVTDVTGLMKTDGSNADSTVNFQNINANGLVTINGLGTVNISTPTNGQAVQLADGGFVDARTVTARIYAYKDLGGFYLYSDSYTEATINLPQGDAGGIVTSINSVTYGGTTEGGHYVGEYFYCINGNSDAYGVVDGVDGNGIVTSVSLIDGGTGYVPSGDTTWYGDTEAITLSVSVTSAVTYGTTLSWTAVSGADGYKVQLWDYFEGIVGDYYVLSPTNSLDYTYDLVYNIGVLGPEVPLIVTPNGNYATAEALKVNGGVNITGELNILGTIRTAFGNLLSDKGLVRALGFQSIDSRVGGLGTQIGYDSYTGDLTDFALGVGSQATGGSMALMPYAEAHGSRSFTVNGYVDYDSSQGMALGYLSSVYSNYGTGIGTLARAIQGKFALGTNVYASAPDSMIIAAGLTSPDTPIANFAPSSLLIGTQTPKIWFSSNGNFMFDNPTILNGSSLGSEMIDTSSISKWGTSGTFQTWGNPNGHGWSNSGSSFAFRDNNGTAKGVTLYQTSANMISPIVVGKTYKLSFYADVNSNTDNMRSIMDIYVGSQQVASVSAKDTVRIIEVYFTAKEAGTLTFKPFEYNFVDYPTLISLNSITLKEVTGGDLTALGTISAKNFTCIGGGTSCFPTDANQNETFWNITVNNKAQINTLIIGNATGNTTFDNGDGTLTMLGTATVWDDMMMPLIVAKAPTTKAPTLTQFRNGTYAMAFADATAGSENELFTSLQMSHSYKLNSTINCHIHYACGTASNNNVTWGLEITKADINGIYPSSTTIKKVGNCSTAYQAKLTDFGSIGNFSGLSGTAIARIFRDSGNTTDNYTGNDAFGISLDCHYEKDTLGSAQEYVK